MLPEAHLRITLSRVKAAAASDALGDAETLTRLHNYCWWGIRDDDLRRFDLAEPRIIRTVVHRVAAAG